jgi:hypothetical protein
MGNKGLLSKKKSTSEKDKKEYNECVPTVIAANFSLYRAQTLLVKGYYIPVKNPLHFVAAHLCVSTDLLSNSIKVS